MNQFTNQDIARYYDLSEVHYNLFWDLKKARSLHYGYWTPGTKNFRQALVNINRVMADMAGIQPGSMVLDAGCGVGGSSLWLAKELNCRVTGISLNKNQVSKANGYAREAGLHDQVQFELKDYCNTGYAPNTFDIVWAIESVCYAGDKMDFIKEAYRLLKPGGRLIVTDFFKTADLKEKASIAVKRMANGWAVNEFTTAEAFEQQLSEAGFSAITQHDASKAILPSARRLYRAWLIGKPFAWLYGMFNRNTTSLSKNNVHTAYLQYPTLKKGWWSYRIFTGEK